MLHIHQNGAPTASYCLSTPELVLLHTIAKTTDEKTDASQFKDSLQYLNEEAINLLDPAGMHIIQMSLPASMGTRRGFVRAMILAKMTDTVAPQTIIVDLEQELYNDWRINADRFEIGGHNVEN